MALGTGSWFPHGPGHDVEAGHEDDVARGLEADDALLLAFVVEPHEDALALKPPYFPTLAVERAGA